jgi:DNA-binding response OmpR family regulator
MKKHILLIDDNEELRACLNLLLDGAGFAVSAAANGREALRMLSDQAIDLVITDLLMPEMEGIETILTIRREMSRLPIIAMSGGGVVPSNTYLSMALGAGVVRTFNKPFEFQDLLRAVRELLAACVPLQPQTLS